MKPGVLYFVLLLLLSIFTSCDEIFNVDIVGDGNLKTESRANEIGNFQGIYLDAGFELHISQSLANDLVIETDSNLMTYIVTEVNNGILEISEKNNFSIISRKSVQIFLTVASELSLIEVLNGGKVIIDTIQSPQLDINVYDVSQVKGAYIDCKEFNVFAEGSTNLQLNGNFGQLLVHQVGSGNLYINGLAGNGNVVLEGSGKISARELMMTDGDVRLYGSGLVFCRVSGLLETLIVGNGRIYYYGKPENVIKNISGEGLVLPADD
ncbi:GIN domain-containing protein [Thermophagus xiamenensis]|uniref:Putative auto-transporter adhesin, head GIN domain n=1 Tax=Thermophagus xiamenensis TaxID=385682 RepID=A0A1I1ZZ38_9BACT|nr:DUF2807 domain-containing protein [Thermophagus xiamenensis]SFE36757.1 Putative auto-transporter adhesin, head GIN domain [Thermophagus xiamenensis]